MSRQIVRNTAVVASMTLISRVLGLVRDMVFARFGIGVGMDAFLGQGFFMGKSWTLDYPNQEVWVNTPLVDVRKDRSNIQKLHFKKNSHGHQSCHL